MDTSNGKVYKNLETALADGADKENLTELTVDNLERNKMLIGVLKFLLNDNAFDRDFLVTTIIDYICSQIKE